MGQAQLLYIVLGMIIIGTAVIVGIDMVSTYNQETNRELLINQCVQIISMAEEYYKTPRDLGGGGGSYEDFEIPEVMEENDIGVFKIRAKNKRVNINARGTVDGNDGRRPVRVIARMIRNRKNPDGVMKILIRN